MSSQVPPELLSKGGYAGAVSRGASALLMKKNIITMKSLFNEETYNEIISRIDKLTPASKPQWGKMNIAQMLNHCVLPLEVAMNERKVEKSLLAFLFKGVIKKAITGTEPFKQGLRTMNEYVVTSSSFEFNEQHKLLKNTLTRYYEMGGDKVAQIPHPVCGTLTAEEWGWSQYKHLDHHLKQFGV